MHALLLPRELQALTPLVSVVDNEISELTFTNQKVPADAIACLAQIGSLRRLSFHGCVITFPSICSLSHLESLGDIQFVECAIECLHALTDTCPALRNVVLSKVSGDHLHLAAHLLTTPSLESVTISDSVMSPAIYNMILRQIHLRKLEIGGSGMSIESVQPILELPHLQRLGLQGCVVDDSAFACVDLAVFHDSLLRSLSVADTRITAAAAALFSQCPELGLVGVDGTAIGDEGVRYLCQCPMLCDLGCDRTAITRRAFQYLRQCDNLIGISCARTAADDHAAAALAGHLKLQFLDLSYTSITDRGLVALSECPELIILVLEGTSIHLEAFRDVRLFPKLQLCEYPPSRHNDDVCAVLRRERPQVTWRSAGPREPHAY